MPFGYGYQAKYEVFKVLVYYIKYSILVKPKRKPPDGPAEFF